MRLGARGKGEVSRSFSERRKEGIKKNYKWWSRKFGSGR